MDDRSVAGKRPRAEEEDGATPFALSSPRPFPSSTPAPSTADRRSSGEDAEPPEKRARGPEANPLPGPLPGFETTAKYLEAFCVALVRRNLATLRPHLTAIARERHASAKNFAEKAELYVGKLDDGGADPRVVAALVACFQAARNLVDALEATGKDDERSPLRSWRALQGQVEAGWTPKDGTSVPFVRLAPHLTGVGDAKLALRDLRAARGSAPALWHVAFQLFHANVDSARTVASNGSPRTLGWGGPVGGWGKKCALLHQGTYPPLHGAHWRTTASNGMPLQKSLESAMWYVTPSLASTSPPRTSSPRRDR